MKFTPEVRAALKEQGATGATIDAIEVEWTRERDCLDSLRCPKCGATVTRHLDERQAGDKPEAFAWYNYRCACGFSVDCAEPVKERLS